MASDERRAIAQIIAGRRLMELLDRLMHEALRKLAELTILRQLRRDPIRYSE
jgi:hypothetical protein